MAELFAEYLGTPTQPVVTPTSTAVPTTTILPPHRTPTFEHITSFGHKVLWVTFALLLVSTISFIVLSWRVAVQKRILYQVTTYVAIIATLSYFAEAVGQGWTRHAVWDKHHHKHGIPDTHDLVIRQIFYARFVDWALTGPLLLFDLGLLAGLSASDLLNVVFANLVLVVSGWSAETGHSHKARWGWFTVGGISFLTIAWQLFFTGRVTAQRRGTGNLYFTLTIYTIVVWLFYPIIWLVAHTKGLSVDSEVLAFAILDLFSKPVFGFWLLLAHRNLPASEVHISGIWSDGFGHQEGTIRVGEDDEA